MKKSQGEEGPAASESELPLVPVRSHGHNEKLAAGNEFATIVNRKQHPLLWVHPVHDLSGQCTGIANQRTGTRGACCMAVSLPDSAGCVKHNEHDQQAALIMVSMAALRAALAPIDDTHARTHTHMGAVHDGH